MYQTQKNLTRTLRVAYPAGRGRIVLRTEVDEVTLGMAMALTSRGWRYGHNLMHLVVPNAKHNESAWSVRLHIPMQFFMGARLSFGQTGDRRPALCQATSAGRLKSKPARGQSDLDNLKTKDTRCYENCF